MWSKTALATLATCPERYRLQYVVGASPERRKVPMFAGTRYHRAIQHMHEEKDWAHWLDFYRENWEQELAKDLDTPWASETAGEELEEAFDDGLKILGNYAELNRRAKVVAVEAQFFMVLQHPRTETRRRFVGHIDQIRESDEAIMHNRTPGVWVPGESQLEVWDLKRAIAKPDPLVLSLSQEFSIYGMALKEGWFGDPETSQQLGYPALKRFGVYPQRHVWYHLMYLLPYKTTRKDGSWTKGDLRGDPVVPVDRRPEDYERAKTDLFRLIQMARMRLFFRTEGKFTCTMCDFTESCTKGAQGGFEDPVDFAAAMEV